eukprot:1316882-Amorphochlora_amoeboformis.AAC.2
MSSGSGGDAALDPRLRDGMDRADGMLMTGALFGVLRTRAAVLASSISDSGSSRFLFPVGLALGRGDIELLGLSLYFLEPRLGVPPRMSGLWVGTVALAQAAALWSWPWRVFFRRHAAHVQIPRHAGQSQFSISFRIPFLGGFSPKNLNRQRSQYFLRQMG